MARSGIRHLTELSSEAVDQPRGVSLISIALLGNALQALSNAEVLDDNCAIIAVWSFLDLASRREWLTRREWSSRDRRLNKFWQGLADQHIERIDLSVIKQFFDKTDIQLFMISYLWNGLDVHERQRALIAIEEDDHWSAFWEQLNENQISLLAQVKNFKRKEAMAAVQPTLNNAERPANYTENKVSGSSKEQKDNYFEKLTLKEKKDYLIEHSFYSSEFWEKLDLNIFSGITNDYERIAIREIWNLLDNELRRKWKVSQSSEPYQRKFWATAREEVVEPFSLEDTWKVLDPYERRELLALEAFQHTGNADFWDSLEDLDVNQLKYLEHFDGSRFRVWKLLSNAGYDSWIRHVWANQTAKERKRSIKDGWSKKQRFLKEQQFLMNLPDDSAALNAVILVERPTWDAVTRAMWEYLTDKEQRDWLEASRNRQEARDKYLKHYFGDS